MRSLILILGVSLNLAAPVYANDSVARVGAGGLVLEKTDDIEMVSEVLEISTEKVKVTYRFLNVSNHDIETTVAFPMPAFDYESHEDNQRPLKSFQMFVDGKEVQVKQNRVFLIDNVDVTERLRKIGLTDDQIFDTSSQCLLENTDCLLTETQKSEIAHIQGENWQIKETVYWSQIFPAGREIEVVHEYKPFSGGRQSGGIPIKEGCVDDRTLKRITRDLADKGPGRLLDVEYFLGTGRNWRGPIKNFKLILRKLAADDVVSLCFPGTPVRTSPVTIEFLHKDFVPQDKLVVYFLHRN